MDKKQLFNTVGNLLFAVAWLSCLSCLIRSDYNFAFAFVLYYMWTSKDDHFNSKLIFIGLNLLSFFDLIWLLSVGGIWCTWLDNNDAWNREHGLHVFVIITSVFEIILKLAAAGLVWVYRSFQDKGESLALKNDPGNAIGYNVKQSQYQI